jgi:hypothetical protein
MANYAASSNLASGMFGFKNEFARNSLAVTGFAKK